MLIAHQRPVTSRPWCVAWKQATLKLTAYYLKYFRAFPLSCLLSCSLLSWPLNLAAKSSSNFKQLTAKFYLAAKDQTILEETYRQFQKYLLEPRPQEKLSFEDFKATVYLGSLSVMMAKSTKWPWKKLTFLSQGIALMDRGLNQLQQYPEYQGSPSEIELRLIRAITNANIPKKFGRRPVALADFQYLLKLPNFAALGAPEKGRIYAYLGILTTEEEQKSTAQHYLEQAALLHSGAIEEAKKIENI